MKRIMFGICGLILFLTGCSKNSSVSAAEEIEPLIVYYGTLYSESSLGLEDMGLDPAAAESWQGEYLGVTSANLFSSSKTADSGSAWENEDYLNSGTLPATEKDMEVYALKELPSSWFLIVYGRDQTPVLFQKNQVFFFSGDTFITPYRNLIFAEVHENGGVLCMDAAGLSDSFPSIADELPQWEWNGQLHACLPSDVSVQTFHVYDADYEVIDTTGKNDDLEEFCAQVPEGVYYISVIATVEGRQVKWKKNYSRSGAEYVFRMNKS